MRYSIILFALLLVGCGQKGALYMPNEKPEVSAPVVIKPGPVNNTENSNAAE
ncbi:MAG: putative small lipoprotein YifL [Psychrobacter glaciei]|jgi:predicted small lipoprotein YifL